MACSCRGFQANVDQQFDSKRAATELRTYRRGRLKPTTRLLRDAIVNARLARGTLLDIGAGIGALTFELLDRGISRAVIAEASAAYVEVIRNEAGRRDRIAALDVFHGDAVEKRNDLPAADIVTLDRVVCCYPRYQPMLDLAVHHAEHGLALSYPRDRWYVRAVIWLDNWKRSRKTSFRTFVHPPSDIQRLIEAAGFVLASRRGTFVWRVDVFVRQRSGTR